MAEVVQISGEEDECADGDKHGHNGAGRYADYRQFEQIEIVSRPHGLSTLTKSVGRVDRRLCTVFVDSVNRERLALLSGHAGRAFWHAGKRDAGNLWTLGKKLPNHVYRHVAVNHIAFHEHRVTALQLRWNARIAADLSEVVSRRHVDGKTVLPQIVRIAFAAPALRILVQFSMRRRGECRNGNSNRRKQDRGFAETSPIHYRLSLVFRYRHAIRSTVIIPNT